MRQRLIRGLGSNIPILDLTLKIKEKISNNDKLRFFWRKMVIIPGWIQICCKTNY